MEKAALIPVASLNNSSLAPCTDLPNVEHILAGQLAASSIAMYKRDVQAYLDYTVAHGLT